VLVCHPLSFTHSDPAPGFVKRRECAHAMDESVPPAPPAEHDPNGVFLSVDQTKRVASPSETVSGDEEKAPTEPSAADPSAAATDACSGASPDAANGSGFRGGFERRAEMRFEPSTRVFEPERPRADVSHARGRERDVRVFRARDCDSVRVRGCASVGRRQLGSVPTSETILSFAGSIARRLEGTRRARRATRDVSGTNPFPHHDEVRVSLLGDRCAYLSRYRRSCATWSKME
jgi:hypothetical protein